MSGGIPVNDGNRQIKQKCLQLPEVSAGGRPTVSKTNGKENLYCLLLLRSIVNLFDK